MLSSYREGDKLKAKIVAIDTEKNKISLGIKPSYFSSEDFGQGFSAQPEDDDMDGSSGAAEDEDANEDEQDDEDEDEEDVDDDDEDEVDADGLDEADVLALDDDDSEADLEEDSEDEVSGLAAGIQNTKRLTAYFRSSCNLKPKNRKKPRRQTLLRVSLLWRSRAVSAGQELTSTWRMTWRKAMTSRVMMLARQQSLASLLMPRSANRTPHSRI